MAALAIATCVDCAHIGRMSDTKKVGGRRGKGRPTGGDAAVGRDVVLDAARDLLKRLPPTRIKRADLARAAGVHPALVNYYFGDKASLINAVVLGISEDLAGRQRHRPDALFTDRLRRRIMGLLEVLAENPHLHELLLERVVYGEAGDAQVIADVRESFMTNSLRTLDELIADGIAAGQCRPVNTKFLYIALIGMCEFPINAFPLFSLITKQEGDRQSIIGPYADFLVDLLIGGLAPRDA